MARIFPCPDGGIGICARMRASTKWCDTSEPYPRERVSAERDNIREGYTELGYRFAIICPDGGIGIHGGLKILCFRACGFKSRSGHQTILYFKKNSKNSRETRSSRKRKSFRKEFTYTVNN